MLLPINYVVYRTDGERASVGSIRGRTLVRREWNGLLGLVGLGDLKQLNTELFQNISKY